MNVVICNKKRELLNNLNIDVIKKIEGEFEAENIIEMFRNFYYQRMVLDITALKNYSDIRELQKLSMGLDMDKIILLLDDNDSSISSEYLSKLISMGIYNFTRNMEGVLYLYNHPNSYRDVAQYHQLDSTNQVQPTYVASSSEKEFCRVIGIKNLTKQSGATTFTYMMVKQLRKYYDAVGVEVDSNDLRYFNSKYLFSLTERELSKFIENNKERNVIVVDVNRNPSAMGMVQEMIYLVEPSIIKLNDLMNFNRNAFKELAGKRIILNQSMLSSKDVLELEYEAKTKFFFNMPPLNERDNDIQIMDSFLNKLGFSKLSSDDSRKKILGIF